MADSHQIDLNGIFWAPEIFLRCLFFACSIELKNGFEVDWERRKANKKGSFHFEQEQHQSYINYMQKCGKE